MTGNTGHRLKVTWIQSLIADGMGKLLMPFMTTGAELQRPLFQHHCSIGTMYFVTITAVPTPRVVIKHLLTLSEFMFMTAGADLKPVNRRQTGILTGMWIMAVETEIGPLPIIP